MAGQKVFQKRSGLKQQVFTCSWFCNSCKAQQGWPNAAPRGDRRSHFHDWVQLGAPLKLKHLGRPYLLMFWDGVMQKELRETGPVSCTVCLQDCGRGTKKVVTRPCFVNYTQVRHFNCNQSGLPLLLTWYNIHHIAGSIAMAKSIFGIHLSEIWVGMPWVCISSNVLYVPHIMSMSITFSLAVLM